MISCTDFIPAYSELFSFHYPQKDYHTMYICEILEILENVTEENAAE